VRETILGDLHEEYLHDVSEVGERWARVRHVSRALGIVLHAVSDTATRRAWASHDTSGGVSQDTARQSRIGAAGGVTPPGRWRGVAEVAGCTSLALVVLVAGIAANTMLFSATQARDARVTSAAGLGGIVLLVASVAVAAMLMCLGPRWLRGQLRGT